MTDNQTLTIDSKVFEFDKFDLRLLTMFKSKYILWPDARYGPKGYRWAYRVWHDDDMGTPTHGAAYTIEDAARAVARNYELRQEIAGEAATIERGA
jgi:hypothetical protein